jgi:hypothetical protein
MFFTVRSPRSSKSTSTRPATMPRTACDTATPPGMASASSRAATLTPSPYTEPSSLTITSPTWMPMRNSSRRFLGHRRCELGEPALHAERAFIAPAVVSNTDSTESPAMSNHAPAVRSDLLAERGARPVERGDGGASVERDQARVAAGVCGHDGEQSVAQFGAVHACVPASGSAAARGRSREPLCVRRSAARSAGRILRGPRSCPARVFIALRIAVRSIDLSSWPAILSTVLGLGVVTLVMVGIRLMFMQTIQQRRERENRQINERLRTLIAAYKTLGGSFTGNLEVDPAHLRDQRDAADGATAPPRSGGGGSATRSRRRSPTSSCSAPRSRCGSPRRRQTISRRVARCTSPSW